MIGILKILVQTLRIKKKKHFKKLQKYQYDIDYLFNEHNEEDYTSNNDINAFKDARELPNERRSNFSLEETNRIREKRKMNENIIDEKTV